LRDVLRAGLSWNLHFFDFFDTLLDPTQTTDFLGYRDPYRLAYLEQFVQLDLRDNLLDPRQGVFAEVRLEQGSPYLGGAFEYVKIKPEIRGYLPLFTKRIVLALRASAGFLKSFVDGTPVTRRLALGGSTSHRGFSSGRLATQVLHPAPQGELGAAVGKRELIEAYRVENAIPLGANLAVLFSADVRLRMLRLFNYWLSWGLFFDAGDAVLKHEDFAWAQLHYAVGSSLQYQTPIGSIRLGLGVRLNRLGPQIRDLPIGRETYQVLHNPDPAERFALLLTIGEAF
jgi:outer membrane protein assembly factor BamA